jgi:hypothetical protein
VLLLGVGPGVEMNQALYAHMNNKRKRKKKRKLWKTKKNIYDVINLTII